MRFEPTERYQTAAAMLDAIRPELPGGWVIHDAMLAPLPEAEKTRVAPRLHTAPDAPPARASRSHGGARTSPGIGNGATPLEGFGTTVGQPGAAVTTGAGAAKGSGARSMILAGGAVVALVAGGALAYRLMAPAQVPSAVQAMVSSATAGAASAATPVTSTVKVSIQPVGASVEVDDKPVSSEGGVVEITGALGSGHKVRVVSGAEETTTKVFVTQEGANPPRIVLAVAAPAVPRAVTPQRPVGPRGVSTASLGLRPDR
jgi:serine/threonine-protein kinase